ncbi:MAG: protein jag [Sphingobacteriales bacterium]
MLSEEQNQQIADLIRGTVQKMGVDCSVSVEQNIQGNVFNIASSDSNLLIGQKGNNLQALQTLVQHIAFHRMQIQERFSVDVDDYKKKREWFLRESAKRALEQVKRTGEAVTMEAMAPYERRVIHAFLSEDYSVETESVGREPDRRIVIKPKSRDSI